MYVEGQLNLKNRLQQSLGQGSVRFESLKNPEAFRDERWTAKVRCGAGGQGSVVSCTNAVIHIVLRGTSSTSLSTPAAVVLRVWSAGVPNLVVCVVFIAIVVRLPVSIIFFFCLFSLASLSGVLSSPFPPLTLGPHPLAFVGV